MLEDASTQKDRRDFAGLILQERGEFRRGIEVRRKNRRDRRAIGATGVHHRHHAFVVPVTGIVMETLVQPRRSRHRKPEQELQNKRKNQRPLNPLPLAKSLHGSDCRFSPDRRQPEVGFPCLTPPS